MNNKLLKSYISKCAKNGQVVVPKPIRDLWRLTGSAELEFILEQESDGNLKITINPKQASIPDLLGSLSHLRRQAPTAD